MLKVGLRLRSRSDFARCYNKGKLGRGKYILVKSLPNYKAHPRVGIVVSKKVSKRAVKRNLIRRRIAAILKDIIDDVGNNDIVIIAQAASITASYEQLTEDVSRAIRFAVTKGTR